MFVLCFHIVKIFKCTQFLSHPFPFLFKIIKRKDCSKEIVQVTITLFIAIVYSPCFGGIVKRQSS